jgi:hypothetical protein
VRWLRDGEEMAGNTMKRKRDEKDEEEGWLSYKCAEASQTNNDKFLVHD